VSHIQPFIVSLIVGLGSGVLDGIPFPVLIRPTRPAALMEPSSLSVRPLQHWKTLCLTQI